ncbi:MAG: XisI protein [Planctomycetaceae bacterium]|nr:XisI protein [Planctomycetaceae bacterium]
MDTVEHYRHLIESILIDLARIPYAHGDIELQTIFDREKDHYVLMLVGRDGVRRVHGCLVHVDIRGGKLWIQRDGTERGVARELLEAGVPKDHIVLAFRSPEMRKATDFAIA